MTAAFERAWARCLVDADPVAAVAALRRDEAHPEALRRLLDHVDHDGLRMTALLVARLRFERLVQGDAGVAGWFERDPRGMSDAFRRYHHEVAPTAHDPRGEAAAFARWVATRREG